MFTFIDLAMIKAVIMLIFTIYIFYASMSLDKARPYLLKAIHALAITAIISIFVVAYNDEQNAIDNGNAFAKNNRVLECTNNNNLYRVSKKDGWGVDGLYFIKDSLMIRADMCEQR